MCKRLVNNNLKMILVSLKPKLIKKSHYVLDYVFYNYFLAIVSKILPVF